MKWNQIRINQAAIIWAPTRSLFIHSFDMESVQAHQKTVGRWQFTKPILLFLYFLVVFSVFVQREREIKKWGGRRKPLCILLLLLFLIDFNLFVTLVHNHGKCRPLSRTLSSFLILSILFYYFVVLFLFFEQIIFTPTTKTNRQEFYSNK